MSGPFFFRFSCRKGSALFLILIALALFAALSYAVTKSGRGGGDIRREMAQLDAARRNQCLGMINAAVGRMMVIGGCSEDVISYAANGSNVHAGAPSDGSCSVYHENGGAVPENCAPDCTAGGFTEAFGKCYKPYTGVGVNYFAARATCQGLDADLASIHNQAENDFLVSLMTDYFYVGLNDISSEGDFVWSDGSPVDYTNWMSGQPDNAHSSGAANCTGVSHIDGGWLDVDCDDEPGEFVCQRQGI